MKKILTLAILTLSCLIGSAAFARQRPDETVGQSIGLLKRALNSSYGPSISRLFDRADGVILLPQLDGTARGVGLVMKKDDRGDWTGPAFVKLSASASRGIGRTSWIIPLTRGDVVALGRLTRQGGQWPENEGDKALANPMGIPLRRGQIERPRRMGEMIFDPLPSWNENWHGASVWLYEALESLPQKGAIELARLLGGVATQPQRRESAESRVWVEPRNKHNE